jgi:hypothetical protein
VGLKANYIQGMEPIRPFRLLDPSGRSLIWVKINSKKFHSNLADFNSPECHIRLCPRPDDSEERDGNRPRKVGCQSPDLITRPCHSQDGMHFRLKDEVHDWLEGMGIRYQFEYRYANNEFEPAWHVGFFQEEKDLAMAFKLAWSA